MSTNPYLVATLIWINPFYPKFIVFTDTSAIVSLAVSISVRHIFVGSYPFQILNPVICFN